MYSFTLQLCLTSYIGLQQNYHRTDQEGFNPVMFALAIFTFAYSFMVAISTVSETIQAYKILFRKFGSLMLMDIIVNGLLPFILAFYGFLLILSEVNYLNAVLNSIALLFIPEIDDQLPNILNYSEDSIIKNFLISQSLKDFDKVMSDERVHPDIASGQFSDFYITNIIEEGTNTQSGRGLQPYQVTEVGNRGVQIDPSTRVTTDCLLRKIEWRYTTGYPRTTKPRIGHLLLTKIDGQEIKITRVRDPSGIVGIDSKKQSLEGLFVMTTFQMSEDVIRLRLCGSHDAKNFLKAFEYYSLWDVTKEAKREIQKLY